VHTPPRRSSSGPTAAGAPPDWVDGELDNYPGVNPQGLGSEHRVLNSNTTWRKAAAITTGHYTANAYADDVIVRGRGAHLCRYPDSTLSHLGPDQPELRSGFRSFCRR
jgi:hypothetical protein